MRTAVISTLLGTVASTHAAALDDPARWKNEVDPLLVNYCFECHDSTATKGDFDLEVLQPDFLDPQAAGHWIEVMDNLNASEMPPEDEPQPTAEERALMAGAIAAELEHAWLESNATGGRAVLRRLTRQEYENTVRDLLDVVFEPKMNPAHLLPPDGSIAGFDKVSRALLLDPSLMDSYFEVAKIVADRAIVIGDPPVPTVRQRLEMEEYDLGISSSRPRKLPRWKSISPDGTGVVSWGGGWRTFGELRHPYNDRMIPVSGRYALRFRAGADPGEESSPPLFRVTRQGEGDLFFGTLDGTIDAPAVHEIVLDLDAAGGGELGLNPVDETGRETGNRYYQDLDRRAKELGSSGDLTAAGYLKSRLWSEGLYGQGRPDPESREIGDVPKIFLDYVEIEGPLYDQWPPASMVRLFPAGIPETGGDDSTLRRLVETLLPRAFRRPVGDDEIEDILEVATSEWEASGDFVTGARAAVVATLCSPSFLYLVEPGDGAPRPVDDFELASRLSYFLWSTMPDDNLVSAAGAGTVRDDLEATITRMLADPRSDSLVDGFAAQWLKTKEFDRFAPDRSSYRDFFENENNGINEALNEEPLAFFREIVRSGGDLRDFLSSDWTMATPMLARWYGLPEGTAEGEGFTRVTLPADSPRGGLVGMGALHKWGSDGSRTKPVDRGKYILDVLFNDPPNPPPPNVGEVEPNVKGERLTVRQRLHQHRQIESCANCHSRLDPYGLALENFNVVGRWRDYQDGENQHWGESEESLIDASGKLPNGTTFETVRDYRAALRTMDGRFFRGFSEKLFIYALGRLPEPVDRPLIDAMVHSLETGEGKFAAAVTTLIRSDAFLTK